MKKRNTRNLLLTLGLAAVILGAGTACHLLWMEAALPSRDSILTAEAPAIPSQAFQYQPSQNFELYPWNYLDETEASALRSPLSESQQALLRERMVPDYLALLVTLHLPIPNAYVSLDPEELIEQFYLLTVPNGSGAEEHYFILTATPLIDKQNRFTLHCALTEEGELVSYYVKGSVSSETDAPNFSPLAQDPQTYLNNLLLYSEKFRQNQIGSAFGSYDLTASSYDEKGPDQVFIPPSVFGGNHIYFQKNPFVNFLYGKNIFISQGKNVVIPQDSLQNGVYRFFYYDPDTMSIAGIHLQKQ